MSRPTNHLPDQSALASDPDPGDQFFRLARLHRHRRGRWEDFWSEHGPAIAAAFPVRAARAELVDRLMSVVLLGIGDACKELE